jgi:hypothetical protein
VGAGVSIRPWVGEDVGAAVGPAVGDDDGGDVGPAVGGDVGPAVGDDDGGDVGPAVGGDVGPAVGGVVGLAVGVDVGPAVGEAVGLAVGSMRGCISNKRWNVRKFTFKKYSSHLRFSVLFRHALLEKPYRRWRFCRIMSRRLSGRGSCACWFSRLDTYFGWRGRWFLCGVLNRKQK